MTKIAEMLKSGAENTILMVTPQMMKEFALSVADEVSKRNANTEEPIYTPAEFAARKRVNKSTLFRWRKAGLLKPHMVGNKLYYRDCDLVEG